jgi:predicted NAD/FAD-dependent oxidoreductase
MELAIIGAGVAGLAAARRLREILPDLQITLYEKSRGLGGRAATRRRDGFTFDHGAQCFKTPSAALEQFIRAELDAQDLFDITKPVWVFDQANTIAEGDPLQNAEAKWCYRGGMNTLGKLLGSGLQVRREVRIGSIHQQAQGWNLFDERGNTVGHADLLLFTAPGPQSADILAASQFSSASDRQAQLINTLQQATYRRCLSFAFGYDQIVHRPYYALINTDRQHPIAWLALEHTKGEQRCPAGHSLLIAQMSPHFSSTSWDAPIEQIGPQVNQLVGDLLAEDLGPPLWADRQGWRYALPDGKASAAELDTPKLGLFFAGDYSAGLGRVHVAIEEGWRAADAIRAQLG